MDDVLDAYLAAWTGRDEKAFYACCTPDVHYEDPFAGRPLEGPGALGAHARRLWMGFPDVRMEPSGVRLHDGRFGAAPVKLIGTNTGELDGLPPTKRFVVLHAVLYCELSPTDDALFRVRAFCDRWDVAVALGLLPKPGTLGEKALLAMRGFGVTPRR